MKEYQNYFDYIRHQSEKIDLEYQNISAWDKVNEKRIINRFGNRFGFAGKTVLCLGARLGGEVRAFKQLGSLAIGTDLNPTAGNEDVLYGDFHDIRFGDQLFDFVYTNSMDHAFDVVKMLSEITRVLKDDGTFICEMDHHSPDSYDLNDTRDGKLIDTICCMFMLVSTEKIEKQSGYTYIFKKL